MAPKAKIEAEELKRPEMKNCVGFAPKLISSSFYVSKTPIPDEAVVIKIGHDGYFSRRYR
jgi:hypothetical protein